MGRILCICRGNSYLAGEGLWYQNYPLGYNCQRLKFYFLADSERSVLKKVDKALGLYTKYKLAPLGKIKAERVDPPVKIQTNHCSIVREIDYEAIA